MVWHETALLLFLLAGWQKVLALPLVRDVAVDLGQNLTLSCAEDDVLPKSGNSSGVMWIREGREDGQALRLKVEPNGALQLIDVSIDDAGIYSCTMDSDTDALKTRINVLVRSPPPALHNVWVKPSTILANILWEVAGTGGYPIIDFTAEYRLKPSPDAEPEDWKPIIPTHIPPNSRQIDVYHLEPNTTYSFRVWATNQLGRGEIVEVEGHTHHSVEELELARHLLAGVENFDTRVWVAAVGIVMGTLLILGLGTCYLLYRECKAPYARSGPCMVCGFENVGEKAFYVFVRRKYLSGQEYRSNDRLSFFGHYKERLPSGVVKTERTGGSPYGQWPRPMKINLRSRLAAQLEEQEVIELVPNIILNPGFFDERTERVPQDENSNNQTTTRLNNNTVMQPRRL